MVTSPRAALNTKRESHLPIYLIGRQVSHCLVFIIFLKLYTLIIKQASFQ